MLAVFCSKLFSSGGRRKAGGDPPPLDNAETNSARTKTALNLLGLAPWKNTHLLGTSNLISFLLGARHAVQSGWSKQFTDYDKQDAFVA